MLQIQTSFTRCVAALLLTMGAAVLAFGAAPAGAQEATPTASVEATPTTEASSTPESQQATGGPTPASTATTAPPETATAESAPGASPKTTPTTSPPASPTASPKPTASSCLDFTSQTDAQTFFEAKGGPGIDPYGLDADRDGLACESIQDKIKGADASSDESFYEKAVKVPVLHRTAPRNTNALVEQLEPLTEFGLPLSEVLVQGMGRFPVAGRAHYFDDWLAARTTPTFHLHKGIDIFADFGTPIRAPDTGIVSNLSNNPAAGGIGVTIAGGGGISYYFGHLRERVEGLEVGRSVGVGTVIGFVGDTGNAKGGLPHLHFEIRRNGSAMAPKPHVDRWLLEAIEIAPHWVEANALEMQISRGLVTTPSPGSIHVEAPTVTGAGMSQTARRGGFGLAGVVLVLAGFLGAGLPFRRSRRQPLSEVSTTDTFWLIPRLVDDSIR